MSSEQPESARDMLAIALFAAADEQSYEAARKMLLEHGQTEHRGDCTQEASTCPLCLWENCLDEADRFAAALAAAGYAVVPAEPTEEMLAAGQGCINVADEDPYSIWCNMLSEAPGIAGTELPAKWWNWWKP